VSPCFKKDGSHREWLLSLISSIVGGLIAGVVSLSAVWYTQRSELQLESARLLLDRLPNLVVQYDECFRKVPATYQLLALHFDAPKSFDSKGTLQGLTHEYGQVISLCERMLIETQIIAKVTGLKKHTCAGDLRRRLTELRARHLEKIRDHSSSENELLLPLLDSDYKKLIYDQIKICRGYIVSLPDSAPDLQ